MNIQNKKWIAVFLAFVLFFCGADYTMAVENMDETVQATSEKEIMGFYLGDSEIQRNIQINELPLSEEVAEYVTLSGYIGGMGYEQEEPPQNHYLSSTIKVIAKCDETKEIYFTISDYVQENGRQYYELEVKKGYTYTISFEGYIASRPGNVMHREEIEITDDQVMSLLVRTKNVLGWVTDTIDYSSQYNELYPNAVCVTDLWENESLDESKKLNMTEMDLNINDTANLLVLTVESEYICHYSQIEYKSDNENIATVSNNGLVTGKRVGQTTVTCSIGDTAAVCKINVEDLDTDGDGLYDSWEKEGIDTDGDGTIDLHLEKMGADPNIPDIFVEVDWMVQPKESIGPWVVQQETSLAPSKDAMRKVYEVFKKHGINLHIDVGSESTDFVTGKVWGDLSGGNEVPYQERFFLGGDYKKWDELVNDNFCSDRRQVFRHALFINEYTDIIFIKDTSSGIAYNIPSQFFIIANQKWVRDTGNIGVAGTFMHELGHTLGLCHGGFAENGEIDELNSHIKYKPNYLSIMNYLFQLNGIPRGSQDDSNEGMLNYSDYKLPTLDENHLNEYMGIDPEGITAEAELGTSVKYGSENMEKSLFYRVAGQSIDFDGSGSFDEDVSVDLSVDQEYTKLFSNEDWPYINYKGGDIGQSTLPTQKQKRSVANVNGTARMASTEELTLEEALKNGVLSTPGTGALEAIGPFTIINGANPQNVYVRVKNMGNTDATFSLKVKESDLSIPITESVNVSASIDKIEYMDVAIPITKNAADGDYTITAILSFTGKEDMVIDIPVSVYTPTAGEVEQLKHAIKENAFEIPEIVLKEYCDMANKVDQTDSTKPSTEADQTDSTKPNTEASGKIKQTITAKNITKTYGAKSFNLNAKSSVGTTLTYTVSDKRVAIVDKKGKVTVKGCGITKITITAKATNKYSQAKKTIKLTVKPKKVMLSSVKSANKKTATVKWKRDKKASGYIIQCATDRKFKKNKAQVTISKNKTVSKTVKKLKAGKKYYVRICAYAKSGKTKVRGAWSKVKTVKVKK